MAVKFKTESIKKITLFVYTPIQPLNNETVVNDGLRPFFFFFLQPPKIVL